MGAFLHRLRTACRGCWHTLLFRHVCGHTDQNQNPWLIFLLPVSGILIVGCYRLLHDEKDTGTNLVLSAIHSDEDLPLRMAPLIFISTLITHLFGGSAEREGLCVTARWKYRKRSWKTVPL